MNITRTESAISIRREHLHRRTEFATSDFSFFSALIYRIRGSHSRAPLDATAARAADLREVAAAKGDLKCLAAGAPGYPWHPCTARNGCHSAIGRNAPLSRRQRPLVHLCQHSSRRSRQRPVQGSHPPHPLHTAGRLHPLRETARRFLPASGKTTTPGPLGTVTQPASNTPARSGRSLNRIIRCPAGYGAGPCGTTGSHVPRQFVTYG